MSIADAIKTQLPNRAEKWAAWTKIFEDEDIDTVGDLRRITQPVWIGLNLSALLRSALEELRKIPDTKVELVKGATPRTSSNPGNFTWESTTLTAVRQYRSH